MKLKNVLIVVKDIEKSRKFYHDLFGLDVVLDNDGNMILTEGLVLQDEKIWRDFLGKDIVPESNSCELYFEEKNIEAFVEKLEKNYPSLKYANRLMTHSWGQKVIRFYDPSGDADNQLTEDAYDMIASISKTGELKELKNVGQENPNLVKITRADYNVFNN